MPDPRYGAEHQAARRRLRPQVDDGQAYCAEPVCVMPTRWIEPGTAWHLSHTPDGTSYIGPSHEQCNTSEGGRRGSQLRRRVRRWLL